MTLPAKAWNYSVTAAFNEQYYKNLLMPNHITGARKSIKLFDTRDSERIIVYVLTKNRVKYALDEEHVGKLPLLVKEEEKILNGEEVYNHILSYQSARFRPEKHHTFRQLVDDFVPFQHENPTHFTLWKIIVLAAYLSRVNLRVATTAGFGKDSAIKAVADLFGDVSFIANPTIAKLEYCLTNKLIMLNEVSDLNAEEKRHMEQFLLSAGDFSNKYTKRSRAGEGGNETYNISKLSLLLCYNDIDHYPDDDKYFDKMFQRAVKERYLPLKLNGKIIEKFENIVNVHATAEEHKEEFVKFIRSMEYYKNNWHQTFAVPRVSAEELGFTGRYAITVQNLLVFINAYARDRDEFQRMTTTLKDAHNEYNRMLNDGNDTLQTFTAYEEKM